MPAPVLLEAWETGCYHRAFFSVPSRTEDPREEPMAEGEHLEGNGAESEGSQPRFKVTDRRSFRPDGTPRQESTELTEETRDAAVPEGKEEKPPLRDRPEGAGFERRPLDEPEGIDFTVLINAMAQPALIYLGEVPHPATGEPVLELEQARLQIDLLDLLRVKCRGNLTQQEESLLERVLYQLRMLYVTRSSVKS